MSLLRRRYFGKQDVTLSELVGCEKPVIKDTIFEDCDILGPALIIPDSSTKFRDCGFAFEESPDELFWEVPGGAVKSGAIAVDNCRFRKCRFYNIGIVGPKPVIDKFRKWIPEA